MDEDQMRDWSLLPPELLVSIAEHLRVADIACLAAVCGGWGWGLGFAQSGWPPPPAQPTIFSAASSLLDKSSPWLILPNDDGEKADYCDLLCPCESESGVSIARISPIPEMVGRICIGGSPDGWIATVDMWLNISILNPLTGEEFILPSLSTLLYYEKISPVYSREGDGSISMIKFWTSRYQLFEEFKYSHVNKVIISSAPPHGIVFLIYGTYSITNQLAMARVGDSAWTPALPDYPSEMIEDVVYDNKESRFYVISRMSKIFVLDLRNYYWGSFQSPNTTLFGSMYDQQFMFGKRYIVFSCNGDLLQVCKQFNTFTENDEEDISTETDEEDLYRSSKLKIKTVNIKVFKYDPSHYDGTNHATCWVNATDLGDQAIFLGYNYSTCISTIDKPWLKSNSVYFAEDTLHLEIHDGKYCFREAGIFYLKNDKFEKLFLSDFKFSWPPPAWFIPSHLQFIL